MRLLKYDPDGKLVFETLDLGQNSFHEPYVVLSHTWGNEQDEVTYQDILDGTAPSKPGYWKVEFCGSKAASEGYKYFWVDTCCIDKSNSTELQEAINSMFRWYQSSARCYVYLSDVKHDHENDRYWERSFRASRWFTRGWTLQELIAPSLVDFFASDGRWLGDKRELRDKISEITNIDPEALQGKPLDLYKVEERWSWSNDRRTKREEDRVYCMLGIFGVHMPLIYGEGYNSARKRIEQILDKQHRVMAIRPREEIQKKTVFIAVMGLTGVGKSTFISHCTNGAAKASGHLDSCTQDVREYSCTYFEDTDVRLIDTPGFDDSDRSDASVLKDVSQWLGETYKQHILLHGVIYLQRITDIRMQMSSWRSLRALRNVCGNDALKNVYLATTMWEKLTSEAEGVQREALLLEPKYWGDMAKKGCKIYRLHNDANSALALVRRVIDGSQPTVLQIQRELVDEAKDFDETDAGREITSELIQDREKVKAEKEEMLRELEERRLWKEETDRKLESLEEMLRKKDTDIENLQSTLEQAGKEISPERMQEKERHEQERQALMEAVAMYEAQTWDDEGEDGLEELEDELKRKDLEIESMRFNLNQTAATKMRQDHDLVQAKRALTEEKDKFKGRLQRREDKIQSLKAEVDEKREKLRAERERTAKERKRGDEYRDKYYDMKARVDRRDQTISSLRGSGSGSGSSRKHRH